MSMLGLCAECGKSSRGNCRGCGKPVCIDHVDRRYGYCDPCRVRLGVEDETGIAASGRTSGTALGLGSTSEDQHSR